MHKIYSSFELKIEMRGDRYVHAVDIFNRIYFLRYSLLFMFICVLTMYHSHFQFLFFCTENLWFLFFVTIVP